MGSLLSSCRKSVPCPLPEDLWAQKQRHESHPFRPTPRGMQAFYERELAKSAQINDRAAHHVLALFVEGPLTYEEAREEMIGLYEESKAAQGGDESTAADVARSARHFHLLTWRLFRQGFITNRDTCVEVPSPQNTPPPDHADFCGVCGVFKSTLRADCGHACCLQCARILAGDRNARCWECRKPLSQFSRVYER